MRSRAVIVNHPVESKIVSLSVPFADATEGWGRALYPTAVTGSIPPVLGATNRRP